MSINPGYISSQPIDEDINVTISLLSTRPTPLTVIDPPQSPGLIVGFYNGSIDVVELFMVDGSGTRYIKAV